MELFASDPRFGKLRIINVYLEFDGPKIFYAENESGSTFLYTGLVTKKLSKTGM